MTSVILGMIFVTQQNIAAKDALLTEAYENLSASARSLMWYWRDNDDKFLLVLNKRLLKVSNLSTLNLHNLVNYIIAKKDDGNPALRIAFILHVLRTAPPKSAKSDSEAWMVAFLSLDGKGDIERWSPWSSDLKTLTLKTISLPIGDHESRISNWWKTYRSELVSSHTRL